jgi:hypothetical protein
MHGKHKSDCMTLFYWFLVFGVFFFFLLVCASFYCCCALVYLKITQEHEVTCVQRWGGPVRS